jgi:hypothetical protein
VSNHLAFATVTAALRDLLLPAATSAVSGSDVTFDRPDANKTNAAVVNLYLYQVTPNAAWRNADLPTRRPDGSLAQRPQAAFDLHYILTFFGSDKDQEPQRLLGSTVSLLHTEPVLSREAIRKTAQNTHATDGTHYLVTSDLAEQVELIRLAPLSLNLEELSKLWSVFFQIPYRLSIAYQASVVLVEPEVSTQPPLPVRARNLYVVPFRQPELDEAVAAGGPGLPILPGDTVVLRGRNLRGEITRVRIGSVEVAPKPADVRDDEVRIDLTVPPFAAGDLRAGVLGAQVVQRRLMGTPPKPHAGAESNVAPFVLRPQITKTGANPDVTFGAPDPHGVRLVTVGIAPQVGAAQRVVLLFNLLGEPAAGAPRAFSAVAERRALDTDPVQFKLGDLPAATPLLVRVQVDGAESPLEVGNDGAYKGPQVTI